MSRLEDQVIQTKLSEDEAHRLLDVKTAQLYGSGRNFCQVYYPPFYDIYTDWYLRHSYRQRVFPGCYVERIAEPRPMAFR